MKRFLFLFLLSCGTLTIAMNHNLASSSDSGPSCACDDDSSDAPARKRREKVVAGSDVALSSAASSSTGSLSFLVKYSPGDASSLQSLAELDIFLDAKKLKDLLYENCDAASIMLERACACENIGGLISLFRAGVLPEAPFMVTESLAKKLDRQPHDKIFSFVSCLSEAQNGMLMGLAMHLPLKNLIVALLRAGVSAPGLKIDDTLIRSICDLRPLAAIAQVMRSLTPIQRAWCTQERVGGIFADFENVFFDFVDVFVSPDKRIDKDVAGFIANVRPEVDRELIVGQLSQSQKNMLLRYAVKMGNLGFVDSLLDKGATLAAGKFSGEMVKVLLLSASCEKMILGRILGAMASKPRQALAAAIALRSSKESLSIMLQLLAVEPLPDVVVTRSFIYELMELYENETTVFESVIKHMNEAQLAAAREYSIKVGSETPRLKDQSDNFSLLIGLLLKPSAVRVTREFAVFLNRLSSEFLQDVLLRLAMAQREELSALVSANGRLTNLATVLGCSCRHIESGPSLCERLWSSFERKSPFAQKIDFDVAIADEFERLCGQRRIDIFRNMSEAQKLYLARMASLLDLKNIKKRLQAIGVAIPSEVDFDEESVKAFIKKCNLLVSFSALSEKQKRTFTRIAIQFALYDAILLLLICGRSLSNKWGIAPEIASRIESWTIGAKDIALKAMTKEQQRQLARLASIFNFKKTVKALSECCVAIPEVSSININDSIAHAINSLIICRHDGEAALGICACLDERQKKDLLSMACALNLGGVIVALRINDATINLSEVAMTKSFVDGLNCYWSLYQSEVERITLSLDGRQRATLASIVQLMSLPQALLFMPAENPVDKTAIVIDKDLAKYFNDLSWSDLKIISSLSESQCVQLFKQAVELQLEKVLIYLCAIDKKFLVPSTLLFIEQAPDLVQQKIIGSMDDATVDMLAKFACLLNMKTIKRQLLLKHVSLPEAAIDHDFIAYLREQSDDFLTQVVDRLSSEQLYCVQRYAREQEDFRFFERLLDASQRLRLSLTSCHLPVNSDVEKDGFASDSDDDLDLEKVFVEGGAFFRNITDSERADQ